MAISSHLHRTAKLVSIIGHPLVSLPLVLLSLTYGRLPISKTIAVSAVLIGLVIVPITWHNYSKAKQGQYTNFDVSDRTQRSGFYSILLLLSGLFACFLVLTDLYQPFNRGAICFFLLLVVSYVANFFLKVSLHTSINLFLACALYELDKPTGLLMGVFSVLVALSRLVLKRHTPSEVMMGGLIGFLAGAAL